MKRGWIVLAACLTTGPHDRRAHARRQVNLPFIGRPIVPSDYGQRFAAGHIVEDGRHLYGNTGTGTSILPVRFRVPPEIVLLTLHVSAEER